LGGLVPHPGSLECHLFRQAGSRNGLQPQAVLHVRCGSAAARPLPGATRTLGSLVADEPYADACIAGYPEVHEQLPGAALPHVQARRQRRRAGARACLSSSQLMTGMPRKPNAGTTLAMPVYV